MQRVPKSFFNLRAISLGGKEVLFSSFKNRVLLVVNVASECGYTKQYKPLQELYTKYEKQGFSVLGFPCNQFGEQEPGTREDIRNFTTSKYAVTFPLFDKIDVNGPNEHEVYKFLKEMSGESGDITWNFEKFLVAKDGVSIVRYPPKLDPLKLEDDITHLLEEKESS